MEHNGKQLLLCSCEASMPLDGNVLAKALGLSSPPVIHTQLCRAQLDRFKTAAGSPVPLVVGCTQEATIFEDMRAEIAADDPDPDNSITSDGNIAYANIRERAGWSLNGGAASAKIAALLAEATLDIAPAPSITLDSAGACLVYGRGHEALEVAKQLATRLPVTLLLTKADDILPPRSVEMPIFQGTIRRSSGHLGAFIVRVDGLAPLAVSSRGRMTFAAGHDDQPLAADLILDLTGGAPLFTGHRKRDGYVRPDPGDPAAVQRALFDLTDLIGSFDKPLYVDFKADLCAHSRSQKTGCSRCLEICPAGAIRADGDVVAIDPFICGGCGGCNSVCPTGAAAYAYPDTTSIITRLRTLMSIYRRAGGEGPVLLIHDDAHGGELISVMARLGKGLPAHVIPFMVNEVTQLGLDTLLSAFAYGAERLVFLIPPQRREETAGLKAQIAYADAILDGLGLGTAQGLAPGEGRIQWIEEVDPDPIEALLWSDKEQASMPAGDFLPLGGKRALMRLALDTLHAASSIELERITMPDGAPFGRVAIDTDGCTLCLACVGACPTGALSDNQERPELRFQEDACVQCGLCVATCPERVIALEPGISFQDQAKRAIVVKGEEPFACIRCNKPFGTKSSIEKIVAILAEKHWMFEDQGAADRIKMCEDCRVIVQFEAGDNPMAGGPRPSMRTTEDDLRERDDERRRQANDGTGKDPCETG